MRYQLEIAGKMRIIDVTRREGGWSLRFDGGPQQAWSGERLGAAEWRLGPGDVVRTARVDVTGDAWAGQVTGAFSGGSIADPRAAHATAGAGGQGLVKSPMPGLVARVLVAPGQAVAVGQVLLVVEAMKMENEFKSKIAGVVREVHVAAGQAVAANERLVTVEG